jgi:protein-disulfide isomerase
MGTQARVAARNTRRAAQEAQRRTRRRHRYLAGGGGLVILALVVAIAVTLVRAAGDDAPASSAPAGPASAPAAATGNGGIAIGTATAPVRVEIYLDYMCPFCGRFERANRAELQRLVADGTIRIELHPLSFLDKSSGGHRYSTRTANAVATVADRAPGAVLAFSNALFTDQPAEGTAGRSDEQIAAVATGAGVPGDVVGAFTEGRFTSWVAASTDSAFTHDGITGTPTVKINGNRFDGDLYTSGALTAAVGTARSRA